MVSGSVGVGVYVDPKNNNLVPITGLLLFNPITAPIGMAILVINTNEAGVYANASAGAGLGISGSVSLTSGTYTSRKEAQGFYAELGGSGEVGGIALGADVVADKTGKIIGGSASVGIGAGTPEGHARAGVTGLLPIIK
jgi:hypothetical protein